ncbi:LacI family transcriptional regulator [Streptomyces sp. TLI_235]|nr:LacI family DNA-binding transcriptional regulator [Streptomyces sp. TLI_235]PBC76983.1 LacI family transcriptional regulator [Streptomyces sp. TLI_235]
MPGDNTGRGRGKPTAGDVAAAAGFSRTAVSFAFNSPDQLSLATRERILAVAEELGYRPSPLARMLRAGRTRAVGVLLPQGLAEILRNPYYTEFLRGVGEVCDQEGYTLLLTPPLRDSVLDAIPYAAVDGFVVCGLETDRGEVAELARHRTPVVLVDGDPQSDAPGVDVDDRRGTREAVRHLIGLGHRRIAVLSFDPGPEAAVRGYRGPLARRLAGLAEGLAEAGRGPADVELAECRSAGRTATAPPSAGWPGPSRPPRSSRSPTSWRSAPWRACATSASTCPARCPWWASTTWRRPPAPVRR